jgi:hypothetical protein
MSQRHVLIISAIFVGALYVAGAVALGSPPEAGDSAATVLTWFRDHQDAARIYAWTTAFGTLSFAVLAALIRGVLPAPHRDVFLLGAAALIVETAIQAWFWAGLALHPQTLEAATARVILDVGSFWGPILTGTTMTMIGSVTVLGLRAEPLIPRWLMLLGAIAFIEQAVETVTVFGKSGFTAPGGPMNLQLGAGLTAVWLIGLVVWAAGRLVPPVAAVSGR